jgi:hypothetical protein
MMIDNVRTPPPAIPEKDTHVRFNRAWKYSPRGFDMVKCKKNEDMVVPKFIADIAVADLDGNDVPAAEIISEGVEEVATAPVVKQRARK